MKYINTFEKFGDFFRNKKEIEPLVIDEKIPIDETSDDEIIKLPVDWASSYDYKDDSYMLSVGDMTNKGKVIEVVEDIHAWYVTDQGSYSPRDLIVFKTKKELEDGKNKII